MNKLFLLLFLFAGKFNFAQQTVTIKGNIENLDDHLIAISYQSPEKKKFDKIETKNSKFEATINISGIQEIKVYPHKYYKNAVQDGRLKFYHIAPALSIFVAPGDHITIGGDAMKMWKAKVEGGRYDAGYRLFRSFNDSLITQDYELKMAQQKLLNSGDTTGADRIKEERKAIAETQRDLLAKFIIKNTSYMYAIFKFSERMKNMQPGEAEKLFALYSPELKNSVFGKEVSSFIEKNKEVGPGRKMVDFTGMTLDKRTFDTKKLRGKYLLLDFWGSWCMPCRASNPHLKELYGKYHNKGFEIVGIAQEIANVEKGWSLLRRAVKEDGLPWIQLLNNELKEKLDVGEAYNVAVFPTKILIDKNGIIVWKGVGSEESGLEDLLVQIFGD